MKISKFTSHALVLTVIVGIISSIILYLNIISFETLKEKYAKASNLVLNADRDLYQALQSQYIIMSDLASTEDFNNGTHSYYENSSQVKARMAQAFLLFNNKSIDSLKPIYYLHLQKWMDNSASLLSKITNNEDPVSIKYYFENKVLESFNKIRKDIDYINDLIDIDSDLYVKDSTTMSITTIWIFAGLIFADFIFLLYLSDKIRKPINNIVEIANLMSEGDFSNNISTNSDGEVGQLAQSFAKLKSTIEEMNSEVFRLKLAGSEGNLELRADTSKYKGVFKTLISTLNNTLDEIIKPLNEATDLILDSNGSIRYVSEAAVRIHGFSAKELSDRSIIDEMIHPEDKTDVAKWIQNIIESGDGVAQFRHRQKFGTWVYIEAIGSNQLENPEIKGILAKLRDITERKLAEEELRNTFEILSLFIKNSPIYTFLKEVTVAESKVLFVSNNYHDITGISAEEMNGKTMQEVFAPEMAEKITNEDITVVLQKKNIITEEEFKGRFYITYKFPILQGDRRYLAGYTIDITERKQAEERQAKLTEQLHQSQKMDAIGQLAGGIAHDFNNLLAGIMGFAELLGMSAHLTEKQTDYANKIISAAERAGNLTKQLLTFSRRRVKASTPIEIDKIINDTIAMLQRTIDKSIEITFESKTNGISIVGDDTILQNAILNISINASHAMTNGGKLSFATENVSLDDNYCLFSNFDIKPGDYIELSIRDTGIGMPPEILGRIFEPFFTTKEQGKGTGLGLAMVYSAIQEHSGAINVYSELGTGTVFHIYLPIAQASKSKRIISESLITGSGTILIIDDEELIRITAKGILESLGYNVLLAENGIDGIEVLTRQLNEIDLIILDMIMPKMGGRETFSKIREINQNIPVLIASGFTKEADLIALKSQGIAGFLQKPFRMAEISEKVNKAICA